MSLALYPSRVRSSDLLGVALGWCIARSSPGLHFLKPFGVFVWVEHRVLAHDQQQDVEGTFKDCPNCPTQLFALCCVGNRFDNLANGIDVCIVSGESLSEFFRRWS